MSRLRPVRPPRARTRLRPTARGWCLSAVAAAALVAAPLLGQRDLLRAGVLLGVLVVAAVWAVRRAVTSLTLESRSMVTTVEAGQPATVHLALRCARRPAARLVLEDVLPPALGGTTRVAVPPAAPGRTLDLRHTVRPGARGSHLVGPAVVRSRDPFGLVEAARPLEDPTSVLDVLPRTARLPDVPFGELTGSRGAAARSTTTSADDSAIREYRVGDDLRRVHWRSTARRGAVMVRSDESPDRPDVVLLLDDRALAHRGRGEASSLEWAVSATASAAVHLHRRGHRVRLVHSGGLRSGAPDEAAALRASLRSLARLAPGPQDSLTRSAAALGHLGTAVLVAVLGAVDDDDLRPLLAARPPGAPAAALLLQVGAWDRARGGPAPPPDASSPADALDAATARSRLVLARAGWRTGSARPDDDVGLVWGKVGAAPRTGGAA